MFEIGLPFMAIAQQSNDSSGNLFIPNKIRNKGKIKAGTRIKERFVLHNNSSKTIYIEYVNPDCNCTSYQVSSYQILPSDSIFIDLELDTQYKYGEEKVYTIIKTKDKEMYKLTIKANVYD